MDVTLAYGKSSLEVQLPDSADVTVVEPRHVDKLQDPAVAVRKALRDPIGAAPLRDLVRASDTVGIAISDITRPMPNELVLSTILSELSHVATDRITLFNATGTHRPNTQGELRGMLGTDIVDRYRVVQNDADDRDSHASVGKTASGNEIWLHREFVDCDRRILTGSIKPHFFAGFSGGGKAVMPGLALLETVMRNHGPHYMDDPRVGWGLRDGNPLWEEIREAAAMVDPSFLLNVTTNRDKEITGVFAGDWCEAHAQGCAFVAETAMTPVDARFDIVITSNSGYPLDLNLYQTVKGMSAAGQIVKEGGSIIVVASCWDGVPEDSDYARILLEAEDAASLLERVRDPDYWSQGKWQAHIQALISLRADIHVYTEHLADAEIERALLTPCPSVEETVIGLLASSGDSATICVLPEGPMAVPFVDQR